MDKPEERSTKGIDKVKLYEPVEELALFKKHGRKINARSRFLQVVFAMEKIIGGDKKCYTCVDSHTQSTQWLHKALWVFVEIKEVQRAPC